MFKHSPPTAIPFKLADLQDALGVKRPYQTFVQALQEYLQTPHVFLASSGRTVLALLLQALHQADYKRQQVILPAYTCPALVKVILDVGLRPVFIDISPRNFTFNMTQLEENVTENSLAIICVHPFGISQDISEIVAFSRKKGVFVIEDGAQSLGATWQGKPLGQQGDFALFSLGPGKPISTGGGGILVTQNDAYARLLASAWTQLPKDGPLLSMMGMVRYLLFTAVFHPVSWWWANRFNAQQMGNHEAGQGYALRHLSATQAGIGATFLPQLDEINQKRRAVAMQFAEGLATFRAGWLIETAVESTPIYLRFPLILSSPESADTLFEKLQVANIGAGRMYQKTLPTMFPIYSHLSYPGATHMADCLITLPTHHFMQPAEIQRILQICHSIN